MKNFKVMLMLAFSFLFVFGLTTSIVSAEELSDTDEVVELVTNEEDVDEISDEELLEAEPSDLPEVEEDEELAERLYGRMLLDVEGNGEVYYVDPVSGGKEYLADGSAAYRLLQNRALGISENDFAKLELGETKEDSNVCKESVLGNRLKGRIVIRVESHGEAYWIYPENCRAYYTGTFDAAYKLMRDFSLGINKADLAKIRNNARQRIKQAFRYSVYAYAEENGVTLDEAREALENEIGEMKTCMENSVLDQNEEQTISQKIEQVSICAQDSDMPIISKEKRQEIKETIRETRKEKQEKNIRIRDININDMFKRVRDLIFKK